jgi:hypothetical protein
LAAHIGSVERKITDSFTERLSAFEQTLEQIKARGANQRVTLVARIGHIEHNVALLSLEFAGKISACETSIVMHQTEINDVRTSIEELRARMQGMNAGRRLIHRNSVINLGSDPHPEIAIPSPTPQLVPPASPSKSLIEVEFPPKEARSLEGIISYLTRKHGGNVHDKGIVTLTSKSVNNDNPKSAAGIALISLLARSSAQGTGLVSGFAGIPTKCSSARLNTQLRL